MMKNYVIASVEKKDWIFSKTKSDSENVLNSQMVFDTRLASTSGNIIKFWNVQYENNLDKPSGDKDIEFVAAPVTHLADMHTVKFN